MSKRQVQVNDPQSIVLVDNNSNGIVSLPREHHKDIILKPGETGQITWVEFVKFKNIPHFGRLIKLNDSIIISDGMVKIKDIGGKLSNEEMIDLLTQDRNVLKEFVVSINDAERVIFKSFLKTRINLGIETEKCEATIAFIDKEFPYEDEVTKPKKKVKAKSKKQKPKAIVKHNKKLIENEDHLSINVVDVDDGDS